MKWIKNKIIKNRKWKIKKVVLALTFFYSLIFKLSKVFKEEFSMKRVLGILVMVFAFFACSSDDSSGGGDDGEQNNLVPDDNFLGYCDYGPYVTQANGEITGGCFDMGTAEDVTNCTKWGKLVDVCPNYSQPIPSSSSAKPSSSSSSSDTQETVFCRYETINDPNTCSKIKDSANCEILTGIVVSDCETNIGTYRDILYNKTYKVKYIGNDIWFLENLTTRNSKDQFTWEEAMSACPSRDNWHLPTDVSWNYIKENWSENREDFLFNNDIIADSWWSSNDNGDNANRWAYIIDWREVIAFPKSTTLSVRCVRRIYER